MNWKHFWPIKSDPLKRASRLYDEAIRRLDRADDESGQKEALSLLDEAATQGHPMAQYRLARLYERGDLVELSLSTAALWYERAATSILATTDRVVEEGQGESQWLETGREAAFRLAWLYDTGHGIPKNLVDAERFYRQAAELGHPRAQFNLASVLMEKGRSSIELSEAARWMQKAAQQGLAAAWLNLGWMYETGTGTPQDPVLAADYYLKGAEHNDARSQFNLGCQFAVGRGVPEDLAQASHWFHRAAEQGDASAQFNLALLYEMGAGLPQDFLQAYVWYSRAALSNIPEAAEKRDQLALLMTRDQLGEAQNLVTASPIPSRPASTPK